MIQPGILLNEADISLALSLARDHGEEIQCLFNKGKYVYQSRLLPSDSSEGLMLDFHGIEEGALMSTIDFYSPVVFVFFHDGLRYQFLCKSSQLAHHEGRACLKAPRPSTVNVVEGRKSPRIEFPQDVAQFKSELNSGAVSLIIREMSLGGFSMWARTSHGLSPHATLKQCFIEFAESDASFSKFRCGIEVVRINYSLGNPPEKSHIISCRFSQISERDSMALQKKLVSISERHG